MLCVPHKQALSLSSDYHHHQQPILSTHHNRRPLSTFNFNSTFSLIKVDKRSRSLLVRGYRSITVRKDEDEDEEEEDWSNDTASDRASSLEKAIKLFNDREYYACHDVLESLWYDSNDPLRTLLHALLQCAVAFHHLFNQNHNGAMMEFGEGVCKLRKLNFESGAFHQFEQEISAVLNFIYQTQLELAACNEDFCIAMEQTERSYQLLEGFGAGQHLYFLENEREKENDITYIVFDPQISYGGKGVPRTRVKLPTLPLPLPLTSNHLMASQNY